VGQIETAAMLLRGSHMVALLSLFGCQVFGRFVVPREAAGVASRLPGARVIGSLVPRGGGPGARFA